MKDGPVDGERLRGRPSSFAVKDDKVVVFDTIQQKIKTFDLQGKFIGHFPVEAYGNVMIAIDDENTIVIIAPVQQCPEKSSKKTTYRLKDKRITVFPFPSG